MRYKKNLTQRIAEGLMLVGVGTACQWPGLFRYALEIGSTVLLVFGVILWFKITRTPDGKKAHTVSTSWSQLQLSLLKAQGVLLIVTMLVLGTFYYHTHLNTRLQSLEFSSMINLVKTQYGFLIVVPWLLYLVVGIGSAHFIKLGKPAFLAGMVYPTQNSIRRLFWYQYCQFCTQYSTLAGIVCLASCSVLLLGDGLSRQMHFPSLSEMPIRTGFFAVLFLVLSYRRVKKVFQWLIQRYKAPLGLLLASYIVVMSFTLVWLHEFSVVTIGQMLPLTGKSPWVGAFTTLNRDHRLTILILGWWLAWLPFMSSWIAKWVLKTSVWKVSLAFIWVPLCLLPALLFQIPENQWQIIGEQFTVPSWQMIYAVIGLALLMATLWHVHSLKDLTKGFISEEVMMYDRRLLRITLPIVMKIGLVTIGLFAFGWPIAHIVVGVTAFYFLVALALFMYRLWQICFALPRFPSFMTVLKS